MGHKHDSRSKRRGHRREAGSTGNNAGKSAGKSAGKNAAKSPRALAAQKKSLLRRVGEGVAQIARSALMSNGEREPDAKSGMTPAPAGAQAKTTDANQKANEAMTRNTQASASGAKGALQNYAPAASGKAASSSRSLIFEPKWKSTAAPEREIANPDDKSIYTLFQMLQYMRPKGSEAEQEFRRRFLYDLPDMRIDKHGNLICKVGDNPDVMWSSHTDSVHRIAGKQNIQIEGDYVVLARKSQKLSDCLGADCASGVWMMREMILAGVPGLYIFHFGEESGGIGSRAIAKERPAYLDNIRMAVAFDRYGFESVITHQFGRRCASEDFAKSVGLQLPGFKADSGGTFTDTASYMDIVPECTNLSIGYLSQHTEDEAQSISHLFWLRERMLSIDTQALAVVRDPAKVVYRYSENAWKGRSYGGYSGYGGAGGSLSRDEYDFLEEYYGYGGYGGREDYGREDPAEDDDAPAAGASRIGSVRTFQRMPGSLADMLRDYPEHCAAILEEHGFTMEDFASEMAVQYQLYFE